MKMPSQLADPMPKADAVVDTAWRGVRRLLAVRLDNLGDVLMTTPALAALRAGLGSPAITLLTSPAGAALLPLLDVVDDAVAWPVSWMKPQQSADTAALGADEQRLIERLRSGRFDAAVIFGTCTQSALPAALICRMAGIPLRLAQVRENPYGLLTHWLPDTEVIADDMRHEVQRQLALVGAIGCTVDDDRLRCRVRPADRDAAAAALLAAGGAPGRRYVVVHPGASAASRRWPADRFGEAAGLIAARSDRLVVYTGSAAEQGLVAQARAAMRLPSVSLCGRLDLPALAALVAGADLVLTNNSGPAHLAAALSTPVVDLYALTNPQHTPWRVASRVLSHPVPCRNCLKSRCPTGLHDCLLGVDVQAAADAALELLSRCAGEVGFAGRSGDGADSGRSSIRGTRLQPIEVTQ